MMTTALPSPRPQLRGRYPFVDLLAGILALVASVRVWAAANVAVRFDPPQTGETSLLFGPSFPENQGKVRVIVSRTAGDTNNQAFVVRYQVGTSTTVPPLEPARPGVDFDPAEGSLVFRSGEGEKSFELILRDDFEVDGPRLVQVTLTGEPGNPDKRWFDGVVELRDNERVDLEQVVVVRPYLPTWGWVRGMGWAEGQIVPLPDGRTLVPSDVGLLCLGPDGIPDSTFGEGTGRSPMAFDANSPHESRFIPLPDGGFYVVRSYNSFPPIFNVARFLKGGGQDPGFALVTGLQSEAGESDAYVRNLFSNVSLSPDTGLLVLIWDEAQMRHRLRRLAPNGTWDTAFQEWTRESQGFPDNLGMQVAPDGSIWLRLEFGELLRLLPDGRPDPEFSSVSGATFFLETAGFDDQSRLYAEMIRAGENQTSRVRILRSGALDLTYDPQIDGFPGATQLTQAGEALELRGSWLVASSANGTVRPIVDVERFGSSYRLGGLASFQALPTSGIRLQFQSCGGAPWWGCSETEVVLRADGSLESARRVAPADALSSREAWVVGSLDPDFYLPALYRRPLPRSQAEVGFRQTGVFGRSTSTEVQLQRSGSTGSEAAVRGRIWRRINGQWDELSAKPWAARFPRGASETTADLASILPADSTPVREYLVKIEEAEGSQFGALAACRLWVVAEELLPDPDSLRITSVPGSDLEGPAWLFVPDSDAELEYSASLGGEWISSVGRVSDPIGKLGRIRVQAATTADAGFFRMPKK